ncbi:Complexin-1 [Merluccius polli]|uniref:Complexin-1 n=1 Tax=Merluccius polli TaxID=89951 RepID=A0AA47P6F4_MERPO|nr:Complexin-1 [Merluccius polli]
MVMEVVVVEMVMVMEVMVGVVEQVLVAVVVEVKRCVSVAEACVDKLWLALMGVPQVNDEVRVGYSQSRVCKLQSQGATKDMGKMLGGEEEKDPDAEKKEEERQEALRQQEEERKAKYAKMEAEREGVRQGIRDKYGIKKKEEKEAEAAAAMEQASEGSLTRPKKAVPTGCGDEEEEEESIVDTVMKFLPGPLMDMFNKK